MEIEKALKTPTTQNEDANLRYEQSKQNVQNEMKKKLALKNSNKVKSKGFKQLLQAKIKNHNKGFFGYNVNSVSKKKPVAQDSDDENKQKKGSEIGSDHEGTSNMVYDILNDIKFGDAGNLEDEIDADGLFNDELQEHEQFDLSLNPKKKSGGSEKGRPAKTQKQIA